ncbi:hypothetical protein TNIN_82841 [Trichonephila inaurata madagascariensis]|uniref:Uncharacterized protein n=1 Tax=Trichonephila inaurata madagascariensis TaxID=2747483 RepID=A0A8X6IAU1_9ARAC|nr:hypothetical protein TNIN_82841 [Trichonephila inaurata madagascariensis]
MNFLTKIRFGTERKKKSSESLEEKKRGAAEKVGSFSYANRTAFKPHPLTSPECKKVEKVLKLFPDICSIPLFFALSFGHPRSSTLLLPARNLFFFSDVQLRQ